MKEEIIDSMVKLDFSDFLLDIPKKYFVHSYFTEEYAGGYSVPFLYKDDFDAAKRGALGIAGRLEECLTRNRCE